MEPWPWETHQIGFVDFMGTLEVCPIVFSLNACPEPAPGRQLARLAEDAPRPELLEAFIPGGYFAEEGIGHVLFLQIRTSVIR